MTEPEVLKQRLVKVLKWVSTFASAAGAINPIFSVAASLLKVVEKSVDDEYFITLENEFKKINKELNVILDQNSQNLRQIKKTAVDSQYRDIEENLLSLFSSYIEIVKAKPQHLECKKKNFIRRYENGKEYQYNLYELVVGKRKVFGQPILDVYWEHSKGDKEVMKNLCKDLAYLFFIGCITTMTYYEFKNDDMISREKEWEKKINEVKNAIGEWM
ncbi:hypothetical protein E1301_Tti011203 [Triplophysa tibetana]|uniref:Rapunzel n=1 Tax=Triplophysa tibetana TaxID=1572043 RepID=A0A5A9N100_9TELE|nr:hypothetical protein E1301_Tti011203 [Triplophysa tibetana]